MTSQTWWSAPAQALLITAVIASPAAGIAFGMAMVSAFASLGLLGVDRVVRRRLRLMTFPGPTGPLSLTILIAISAAVIAGFILAIVFEVHDQRFWLGVTASVGFVVALIGSVGYDLANARELRRAH
ncbi:hypothetical protein D6T64_21670 [Cryobacterium melibiosiphilum]|uniref:Uncharacterized protein n=1 Tax=Cryobacterium melibiosiphilum TaxID=995039 RepID=A0A3A5MGS2_9MICO|nr:hypothetical protein [Cryobacterium melibiosiphilum]RJT84756.1 hypothetical protein D6T64_21670 [Cryobacterium melibiosiphilum]